MTKLNWQDFVYEAVKNIPRGQVSTYGTISKYVKVSPRMVGHALHCNPEPEHIPCHRVVDRNGKLAENFAFSSKGRPAQNRSSRRVRIEPGSREGRLGGGGWKEQKRRLLAEGVKFRDKIQRHVDFLEDSV